MSHWQGLLMIGLGPIRILRLPSWPKYHDIQTQASNFDYSTTKNAFPTRHQLGFAKLLYLWFCKCWMQFLWSNAPGNCPPLCQNNYLSRSPRGQQWNVVNFCKVRYNRAIEDLKNSTCRQKKVFNQGICNLYVDPASSAYRILRYCLVSRQPPVAQSKVARQHCWQAPSNLVRGHLSMEKLSIWHLFFHHGYLLDQGLKNRWFFQVQTAFDPPPLALIIQNLCCQKVQNLK